MATRAEEIEYVIDQVLARHRMGTRGDGVPAEIMKALADEGWLDTEGDASP